MPLHRVAKDEEIDDLYLYFDLTEEDIRFILNRDNMRAVRHHFILRRSFILNMIRKAKIQEEGTSIDEVMLLFELIRKVDKTTQLEVQRSLGGLTEQGFLKEGNGKRFILTAKGRRILKDYQDSSHAYKIKFSAFELDTMGSTSVKQIMLDHRRKAKAAAKSGLTPNAPSQIPQRNSGPSTFTTSVDDMEVSHDAFLDYNYFGNFN